MILKALIPLALATGLLATGAIQQHFQGSSSSGHFSRMEAKLGLSPDQKKAIHQVIEQHRPTLAARMEALVQARNAALDAGMDPAVSPEAWRPYQETFAQGAYDLVKEVRATYLEALPILSDSQRADGKAMLKQLRAHLAGMHGMHGDLAHHLLKSRLDLTEPQEAAIQAIVTAHRPALESKLEALHQLHAGALDAALDPTTSQEVLDQNFLTIRAAGFALSSEVRATYLEAQAQLTPEQRQKTKDLVKDLRTALDGIRKLIAGSDPLPWMPTPCAPSPS